jgi:superfamily I DNA/RNA helicase
MEIIKVAEEQRMNPIEIFQAIVAGAINISGITINTAIVKRYRELFCRVNEWKEVKSVEGFLERVSKLCGEDARALDDRIKLLCANFEKDDGDEVLSVQLSKYLVKNIIDIISSDEDTIEEGRVRVMTCHSAKGLSGKLVIVASCVDGLIPRINEEQTIEDIDEQRRLFYVALTRCKYTPGGFSGRLILSSFVNIQSGQKLNLGINVKSPGVNTSRFLMEINPNFLPRAQKGGDFLAQLIQ